MAISKYERSRLDTIAMRDRCPKDLRPLFDHCLNLAADAHKRGHAKRAGLDLLHARRLVQKHGS